MNDLIAKKEITQRLAKHMQADEKTAGVWLDAVIDVLYEAIKEGNSVTLPGLGGFHVRPRHDTWVFKFNAGQKLRAVFGWSSSYKGKL